MNIKKLLIIHAIVTLAAGLVLIIFPTVIPQTVNMMIEKNQYLLCYFLAAAEVAIAYLSFYASKLKDAQSLKLIINTMIIFHAVTLLLELLAYMQEGVGNKIVPNIALRIVIIILFGYFGLYKISKSKVSI